MIGELATSIAHEVNQPLAGVITNAEAGLRWLDTGAPNIEEVKNSLEMVVRDGNRASKVIQRVREFTKNESNGEKALDLREVIRETIALIQSELQRNKIAVSFDFPDTLPAVSGNPGQLEQVVLNLIVNAVEAMSATNGHARELSISARQSPDGVLVAIRDSGVGVDPANIDKIYDAFFTTKATGVGMGLSISRSIVQAHGGQIWATHNEGPGLTVQFNLPTASGNAS